MRLRIVSCLLALCVAVVSEATFAVPVVSNTSYRVAVQGIPSGLTFMTATFDGVAESVTRTINGVPYQFTLNETQTDLGGGAYRLSFLFTGSPVMFPAGDTYGGVGVGLFTDPLDLLFPVDLVSSATRVYNADGSLLSTGGNIDSNFGAWSGAWPTLNSTAGFGGTIGAAGITRFELDLNLQAIPEPGTLALLGFGLAGFGLRRREKA